MPVLKAVKCAQVPSSFCSRGHFTTSTIRRTQTLRTRRLWVCDDADTSGTSYAIQRSCRTGSSRCRNLQKAKTPQTAQTQEAVFKNTVSPIYFLSDLVSCASRIMILCNSRRRGLATLRRCFRARIELIRLRAPQITCATARGRKNKRACTETHTTETHTIADSLAVSARAMLPNVKPLS